MVDGRWDRGMNRGFRKGGFVCPKGFLPCVDPISLTFGSLLSNAVFEGFRDGSVGFVEYVAHE